MTTDNISSRSTRLNSIPIPMIFVLALFGYGAAGSLIPMGETTTIFGPLILSGPIVVFYKFFCFVMYATGFTGIIFKWHWSWRLSLGWLGFSILLALVNSALSLIYPQQTSLNIASALPSNVAFQSSDMIIAARVFSILVGLILRGAVIIYLFKKKDYFDRVKWAPQVN